MDDREWMYTGRSSHRELTDEWIEKTNAFLELAFDKVKGARATWCPCTRCENKCRQTKVIMGKHLCKNGFMANYTRWTCHGEDDRMRDEVVRQRIEDYDEYHEAQFDEVVMRAGGGKKRGWYYIGDDTLDTVTTPTLAQVRARSTSSSPAIRLRLSAAQLQVQELQAQMAAQAAAHEAAMAEEWRIRVEETARHQAEVQQQMSHMYNCCQALSGRTGLPPPPIPPMIFPPAPVPATSNQSTAASNTPDGSPGMTFPPIPPFDSPQ